ncbi:MAG TPA: type II toxin-antitoxin system MqsA family antitoxin [Methanoregulaceae archaeon]|nr:type II toxin-antitoxin system MqsA family antitoxin [Methanoregulaceae archaeon]
MKCVICKHGDTREGTTTVTLDREGMTLVLKDVPAQVCSNCGEDYVDEHVAREIFSIAERMAQSGAQIDVRKYIPGSAMPC